MLFLYSESNDPYFNLATEEFLMKRTEDMCLIYRNRESVVVGKHQNTLKEINYRYLQENQIPVVRRLSGGGTVFHDLGNINISFHLNVNDISSVNYRDILTPIVDVLNDFGLGVSFNERNDILIRGKKISGNAEHISNKRLICHCTLLYSTDLDCLDEAILSDRTAYSGKSVNSVRSFVTNIANHMQGGNNVDQFLSKFIPLLKSKLINIGNFELSEDDVIEIAHLVNTKYRLWSWNYGYSPRYSITREMYVNRMMLGVFMSIQKGIIKDALITVDGAEKEQLKNLLLEKPHNEKTIVCLLENFGAVEKDAVYELM